MGPSPFVERWKQHVDARDLGAAGGLFADDVVFSSPVVHVPIEGVDAVVALLDHVGHVFRDLRYTHVYEEPGGGIAMQFETSVEHGGRVREVEGVDLFQLDEQGRIVSLTVMLRPLSGLLAVAEAMRDRIASA